jgi:hypothetical protein
MSTAGIILKPRTFDRVDEITRRGVSAATRWRIPIGSRSLIRAWLIGWELVRPNVWKYAWEQTVLNNDLTITALEGGLSGTTSVLYAVNPIELNNPASGTRTNGVKDDRIDYPAGYSLQPLGGGESGTPGVKVPVKLSPFTLPDGTPIMEIVEVGCVNLDDGTCT